MPAGRRLCHEEGLSNGCTFSFLLPALDPLCCESPLLSGCSAPALGCLWSRGSQHRHRLLYICSADENGSPCRLGNPVHSHQTWHSQFSKSEQRSLWASNSSLCLAGQPSGPPNPSNLWLVVKVTALPSSWEVGGAWRALSGGVEHFQRTD